MSVDLVIDNFPCDRLETENENWRLRKLDTRRTLDEAGQQKVLGTKARAVAHS